MKRDDHAGSRTALEHLMRIGAHELKTLDAFYVPPGGDDLDDNARQVVREGLRATPSEGVRRLLTGFLRSCSGTVCIGSLSGASSAAPRAARRFSAAARPSARASAP